MFLFNNFPPEIRALIWGFTVGPRTVEVNITGLDRRDRKKAFSLVSTTPIPAPLQICREARNLGLYKQAFSDVGSKLRYIWVNLDIDMISIGKSELWHFHAVAPSIRRLRFQREHQEDFWFVYESKELRRFVNVEEIHVVCQDGWFDWGTAAVDISWPCAEENVLLFDPDEDLTIKLTEVDQMCIDWMEETTRIARQEENEITRQELADRVPL
ncbi:hypothetical protein V492_08502 [Pseudogymnoascus sp. VKM F-4246]|nr:hypothetical protein V492_08502 [Pseudogymnoascus sp. VKM F-4246]